MIKLNGVEKYYGAQQVLKGINLEVQKGEFISVMGSSGSGKSTLLNLIGGMDRPEKGEIILHGENVAEYTDEELTLYRRKKIGFVFQFFNLLPNITVFENISMPLLLNGSEDVNKVFQYIKRIGLEGRQSVSLYRSLRRKWKAVQYQNSHRSVYGSSNRMRYLTTLSGKRPQYGDGLSRLRTQGS